MKRQFPISLAANLAAACLGLAIAVGWPRSANRENATDAVAEMAGPSATGQRSGNREGNGRRGLPGEYAKAWDRLWRDRQRTPESFAARLSLLAEWAELDPAAALAAALAADGAPGVERDPFSLYGTHFSAFQDFIKRRPMEFFELVKGERFGLDTGLARRRWLQQVAWQQPGLLPTVLNDLGTKDRVTALDLCFTSREFTKEQQAALVKSLAALPDDPRNRTLWDTVGKRLASQPTADLLGQYAEAEDPGSRRIVGAALEQQVLMTQGGRDAIKQSLAGLPDDLRPQVMEHILANPRNNAAAMTLALDDAIKSGDWAARQQASCIALHKAVASCANAAEIAEWAGTLPEREDCEDLYRVGVRQLLAREPDRGWEWIGAMPSGWQRDNALTEFINGSLHSRSDEAAAQRALDLIESEHFRAGATQMLAKWQAGKAK
jgi:hypothetical protein